MTIGPETPRLALSQLAWAHLKAVGVTACSRALATIQKPTARALTGRYSVVGADLDPRRAPGGSQAEKPHSLPDVTGLSNSLLRQSM